MRFASFLLALPILGAFAAPARRTNSDVLSTINSATSQLVSFKDSIRPESNLLKNQIVLPVGNFASNEVENVLDTVQGVLGGCKEVLVELCVSVNINVDLDVGALLGGHKKGCGCGGGSKDEISVAVGALVQVVNEIIVKVDVDVDVEVDLDVELQVITGLVGDVLQLVDRLVPGVLALVGGVLKSLGVILSPLLSNGEQTSLA